MDTAKEEVRRILESLPDDATLEDIQYRIYVRQAIAAGVRDIDQGRIVSQDEVERQQRRHEHGLPGGSRKTRRSRLQRL